MKVEVKATEKKGQLEENLSKEFEVISSEEDEILVETEDPRKVARRPGVRKVKTEEETIEGVEGSPLEEYAFTSLETKKDAVRALIATIDGYRLLVKSTTRRWDLKQLKKYNPGIKQIDANPSDLEELASKSLDGSDDLETVEIPLGEKWEKIYREMLT